MIILYILLGYALAFYVTISAIIFMFLSLFTHDATAKLNIALRWPLWLALALIGNIESK